MRAQEDDADIDPKLPRQIVIKGEARESSDRLCSYTQVSEPTETDIYPYAIWRLVVGSSVLHFLMYTHRLFKVARVGLGLEFLPQLLKCWN